MPRMLTPAAGPGHHLPAVLTMDVDVPSRVITITGELDLAGVEALDEAVALLADSYSPADIVIDLSRLTFLDVNGLNRLHALRRGQHRAGATLFVVGIPQQVSDLYALAGLETDPEPPAPTA